VTAPDRMGLMAQSSSGLEVEAVPPKEPGLTLRRLVGFVITMGREEMGSDHCPSVVVVNRRGQQYRLIGASDWEEAIDKRDRLRTELAQMDEDAWCDRDGVPGAFVRGDWPPEA
jgi:hypothetical protein